MFLGKVVQDEFRIGDGVLVSGKVNGKRTGIGDCQGGIWYLLLLSLLYLLLLLFFIIMILIIIIIPGFIRKRVTLLEVPCGLAVQHELMFRRQCSKKKRVSTRFRRQGHVLNRPTWSMMTFFLFRLLTLCSVLPMKSITSWAKASEMARQMWTLTWSEVYNLQVKSNKSIWIKSNNEQWTPNFGFSSSRGKQES